jgi:DNA-binding LacI/PurR family transcriptional regulator
MAVTQKDIALRVGVSQQLVAFALNGKGRMSDDVRQRIQEEARRSGYRPNRFARAFATNKTNLIAVWVPYIQAELCARILNTCERIISDSGYEMIVLSGLSRTKAPTLDSDCERRNHLSIMKWPTDGVLVFDPPLEVQTLMQNEGLPPTVLMGPYAIMHEVAKCDSVGVTLKAEAIAALQHLVGKGCKRILFITTPNILAENEPRSAAYFEVMQEVKLVSEVLPVKPTATHRTGVQLAFEHYVACHGWPDALFCSNDDAAVGALRVVRAHGKRSPEDIKIIGCDGIEHTQDVHPPISTIIQPVEAMCLRAWELLERRLSQPEAPFLHETLSAQLLLRDSSQ